MAFRNVKVYFKVNPLVDLVYMNNANYLGTIASLGDKGEDLENPYYAAGQVYTSEHMDSLLAQAYFNPLISQLVGSMCDGSIFSFPITQTPELIGKNFELVFNSLIDRGLLPVAIHRKTEGIRLRCVISNPAKDLVMQESDIIFYLVNCSE